MSADLEGLSGAAAEQKRSCLPVCRHRDVRGQSPSSEALGECAVFRPGSHPQAPAAGTWMMANVVLHKR